MATDYILAVVALGAAAWLQVRAASSAGRCWAAAFAATAVAAILGGTSHGYAPVLSKGTHGLLWRLTYVTVSAANLGVLAGAVLAGLPRRFHRPALAVLLVRMVAVAGALVVLAQFRYVLYDYAITLAGLAALAAALAAARRPGYGWLMAGIVSSTAGAIVQLTHLGHGRAFNHNDLFHVLQALGIVLYARAGRDLVIRESP